jgi:hypothetical protein
MPTTTCLFSVLFIARCGLKLGVGEKKKTYTLINPKKTRRQTLQLAVTWEGQSRLCASGQLVCGSLMQ